MKHQAAAVIVEALIEMRSEMDEMIVSKQAHAKANEGAKEVFTDLLTKAERVSKVKLTKLKGK